MLRSERNIWISLGLWRNGWLVEELLIVLWIWGEVLGIGILGIGLWGWGEVLGMGLWGWSEILGIGCGLIGGSISLLKILNGSLEWV